MNLSTLIERYGKPSLYLEFPRWANSDRLLTLHHAEASREADWAEPGASLSNVLGYLVFPRNLPRFPDPTAIEGCKADLWQVGTEAKFNN
jgi:hypothetical protein